MKKKFLFSFLFFFSFINFHGFYYEPFSNEIEISEKLINAIEFSMEEKNKNKNYNLALNSFCEYKLIKKYEHLIIFAFIQSILLNKAEKSSELESLRIIFSENKIKKHGNNFLINKKITRKENLILLYLYSVFVSKNFCEFFDTKFNKQKTKFNESEFNIDEILKFNSEGFKNFILNFSKKNEKKVMKTFIKIDVDGTIVKISENIDLYFNDFKIFLEKSNFKSVIKNLFNLYIGTFFNKFFLTVENDLELKDKIMFAIPSEALEISSNIELITNDNFQDGIKNFIMANTMLTTKKYYFNKLNFESIWNYIILKNYSGIFKDIIEKYNNKKS